MSVLSNPRVLKRFIIYMGTATVVMFTVWMIVQWTQTTVPGDFETRQGDIHLSDGDFAEAIQRFDAALAAQPNHRGAWSGKAAALIALERYDEAERELTALIAHLENTLAPDDPTGKGALSAAYGNRGIIKDRQGRYQAALDDYVLSIKVDYDIAEGPGWLNRLLYHDEKPSSVLQRAEYLYSELQKPEGERVLRQSDKDATQRMYKP